MYNAEQVTKGLQQYAENEIIVKLPTIGKWVLGTGIGIVNDRMSEIVVGLQENQVLKMLGVVDDSGNFDIDTLAVKMREAANKYGKAYLEIPLLGKMTFSADDIEILRSYIERA